MNCAFAIEVTASGLWLKERRVARERAPHGWVFILLFFSPIFLVVGVTFGAEMFLHPNLLIRMKNLLLFASIMLLTSHTYSQNSVVQLTSENMAFFTVSVNGMRLASEASIHQEITGLQEGAVYNLFIDYVAPEYSDIQTKLSLSASGGKGSGIYNFTIPSFFQDGLRLDGYMSTSGGGVSGMDQISMNLNVDQLGMNVNMNISDGNLSLGIQDQPEQPAAVPTPVPAAPEPAAPVQVVYVEGYTGRIGCERPVGADRFAGMMETISDAAFSDDKVRIAKQIMRSNCLVIEQLVEILEEITFDEGQLDLAKFAYEHIYDLENYYQVYGVFSFSSSGEELDEYIQDKE